MNRLLQFATNGSVFHRRMIAFFIDLAIVCVVTYVLMVLGELLPIKYGGLIAEIIGVLLMIFRDAFGKSPGKIMMRLTVINIHTNKQAAIYQRILRNITTPLWMLEVLICRFNNGLRLTDMWLGTKVVSDQDAL